MTMGYELYFAVDCRVGSLEKINERADRQAAVDCRVGSLEMATGELPAGLPVDCRVGSLENLCAFL